MKLCWVARRKWMEDGRIINWYKYSLIHSLTKCVFHGEHWPRSHGSRRGVAVSWAKVTNRPTQKMPGDHRRLHLPPVSFWQGAQVDGEISSPICGFLSSVSFSCLKTSLLSTVSQIKGKEQRSKCGDVLWARAGSGPGHFCSHSTGENWAIWPLLTAREAGKYHSASFPGRGEQILPNS